MWTTHGSGSISEDDLVYVVIAHIQDFQLWEHQCREVQHFEPVADEG